MAMPLVLMALGAVFGRISANIVWGYIYGIGSRVVTDEKYEELLDDVGGWGAAAGVCSGLAVTVLPRLWPPGAFVLLQPVSVLAGCVGGNSGWRQGLIGFFAIHALTSVACIVFMVAKLAMYFRRSNQCG
jgi:hypothetical protein